MSYSSNRNLVVEAASWTVAAGIFAAALLNFDQLRLFTASVAGIDLKAAQAAQPPKSAGAQDSRSGSVVELRAGHNGHFETEAEVNGRAVQVMVDTGATGVALSYEDAETAGIYVKDSDFTHQSSTANGIARICARQHRPYQHRRHHRPQRSRHGIGSRQAQGHIARHVVPIAAFPRGHAPRHAGATRLKHTDLTRPAAIC